MVDHADNSIIQTGQSINITITTEQPATGTLTAFSPDKTTSWSLRSATSDFIFRLFTIAKVEQNYITKNHKH